MLHPGHRDLRILDAWLGAQQDQPAAVPDEDEVAQAQGHG
jgi:hypothetical protein